MIARAVAAFHRSPAGVWYDGLGNRDRQVVAALAATVILVLAYLIVWRPASEFRTDATDRLVHNEAVVDWLESQESAARSAGARSRRGGGLSVSTLAGSAREAGVSVSRFQPEGNGFAVVVQGQDFGQVMRWLGRLESREGVVIRQANFDGQAANGTVNGRISFR